METRPEKQYEMNAGDLITQKKKHKPNATFALRDRNTLTRSHTQRRLPSLLDRYIASQILSITSVCTIPDS